MTNKPKHRVIIVGAGFGGLRAARCFRRANVDLTLIDKRNFHLFQPLLYQVATGGLSPANISAPIRSILRRQNNCTVRMGTVTGLDPASSTLILEDARLPFDSLILATGVTHSYFGNDHWSQYAPGLKTVEEATEIRACILAAFENAERLNDPHERQKHLTFIVIGAGPTGVEMAGAIAELRRNTLKHDFRNIQPAEAKVILIDMADRVLGSFHQNLSAKAQQSLRKLGVQLHLNARVINITTDTVTLESENQTATYHSHAIVWAAGVRADSLTTKLAQSTNCPQDNASRLLVNPDFTLASHQNIFAIGDVINYPHQTGQPLPGVAPVAMQQGKFVANVIKRRIAGKPQPKFHYKSPGNLATIGRSAAVAELGKMKFSGFLAWFIWLVVHLMQIVQHHNRVLIFIQWAWNYITFNRSARLITNNAKKNEQHNSGNE